MSYKKEFGADFDLGFNLNDYPYLKDKSWHNDISPSFYFNIGSLYYVLWVDYQDPEQREESNSRYLIQEASNEGTEDAPEIYCNDGEIIFKNDSYSNLDSFLNELQFVR